MTYDFKLAVMFRHLGPYHHARLRRAMMEGDLVAFEQSRADHVYGWEPVEGTSPFPCVTVFKNRDAAAVPRTQLRTAIREALEALRPDVVAIPGWGDRGALYTLDWCISRAVPTLVMTDSTKSDFRRYMWKETFKRRLVAAFGAALASGSRARAYLVGLGLPRDRIELGYDVVDNEYFASRVDAIRATAAACRASLGLPDGFFLAAGRFIALKNHVRLLDAYASYRARSPARPRALVLVGDGPSRPELTERVVSLGLDQHVLLPGFAQYRDLPVYYGLADAFVHPSTRDTWGLVVNEAMASGLPVIVSDACGCVPELVQDGLNGFLCDPTSSDDIADKLCRIPTGAALTAMGAASRRIIAEWDTERFAAGLWRAARLARERGAQRPVAARLVARLAARREQES